MDLIKICFIFILVLLVDLSGTVFNPRRPDDGNYFEPARRLSYAHAPPSHLAQRTRREKYSRSSVEHGHHDDETAQSKYPKGHTVVTVNTYKGGRVVIIDTY